MHTVNQTIIAEVCAAAVGKRLSLETMRIYALDHGTEGFEAFREAGRIWFATRFGVADKRSSLALMQKDQVPGVGTFYTYANCILRLCNRVDAGDGTAITELSDLTTAKATGKNTKKGAKAAAKPAPVATVTLTMDDAIGALETAHKLGGLSAEQYGRIATLRPLAAPVELADIVPALLTQQQPAQNGAAVAH